MSQNCWLNRYSIFTASATLFLIFAGGMVTSTGSGLAVPDWPLSYGMLMPPMIGGIFYEHGHRLIAATVGLLTIVLAVWLFLAEKRKWVRMLGLFSIALVCFQGLLGGLTVLFLLPTAISVGHATLAQIFFSTVVTLAVVTSQKWKEGRVLLPSSHKEKNLLQRLPLWGVITLAAVFIQLILGAWMRHSEAGLAVPDFPLVYGKLFPADLDTFYQGDTPFPVSFETFRFRIYLHYAHRCWALIVMALIWMTSLRMVRHLRREPLLFFSALFMMTAVVAQILLGALVVWTKKYPLITTSHVVVGAMLLAGSLIVTLFSFRFRLILSEKDAL
ncbi:MAG: COX15/CtaA family protein [Deltaproteobacteria bacterium]|nr:COX15/CtaA family protein [Deltaproteobacteria bacterium]